MLKKFWACAESPSRIEGGQSKMRQHMNKPLCDDTDLDRLQADRDVCIAAVQKDGFDIQFASDAMNGHKDICKMAGQPDEFAIQHVSRSMLLDGDVCSHSG